MALLHFVTDELLEEYSRNVLDKVLRAYQDADTKMHSNVVDPFSALFDTLRQGVSFEEWLVQERSRQVQKTLQNAVGDFHQNILGSVKGWTNPGRGGGYDLINENEKVICEVKNKFNTMNSSSAETTYRKLERYVNESYQGYTGYVVFIVPKLTGDYDIPWSPNQATMLLREDIRKIDGESFYARVTGDKDALEKLFDVMPDFLSKLLETTPLTNSERQLLKQLFLKAYK